MGMLSEDVLQEMLPVLKRSVNLQKQCGVHSSSKRPIPVFLAVASIGGHLQMYVVPDKF
jgi:hypothetical protein